MAAYIVQHRESAEADEFTFMVVSEKAIIGRGLVLQRHVLRSMFIDETRSEVV